jgi:hypothetical protein
MMMMLAGDGDGDGGDVDDGQAVLLKTTKLESEEGVRPSPSVSSVGGCKVCIVVVVLAAPVGGLAGEDEEKGPTTGWS